MWDLRDLAHSLVRARAAVPPMPREDTVALHIRVRAGAGARRPAVPKPNFDLVNAVNAEVKEKRLLLPAIGKPISDQVEESDWKQ